MAPGTPISQRGVRTRSALLGAGLDLLVDRPIDAIPIDDIVLAAGVAKGTFFNHFKDKNAFDAAVAGLVRAGMEVQIDAANSDVDDPVERLANGMRVAAEFALTERRRAIVMLRGMAHATARDNVLNRGVAADMARCADAGMTRSEAQTGGVLYWLGLCQVLMIQIVEENPSRLEVGEALRQMLVLGLSGLGVEPQIAKTIASQSARRLTN